MSVVPDSDSASRSDPMDPSFDQVMSDAMDRAEVSIAGSSSLPPPPQPTGPGAALLRARANFQRSSSTSSNSSSSSSSSSSATSVVPTAKDIGKYKSMLYNLLLMVIPRRKKTPRGRFDKYETARRDYISNYALPLSSLDILEGCFSHLEICTSVY